LTEEIEKDNSEVELSASLSTEEAYARRASKRKHVQASEIFGSSLDIGQPDRRSELEIIDEELEAGLPVAERKRIQKITKAKSTNE
jgi:hypothetical protein